MEVTEKCLDKELWNYDYHIVVVDFDNPKCYDEHHKLLEYSTHGGDEDGAVIFPKHLYPTAQDIPWFVERIWDIYNKDVNCIEFKNCFLVIWAHG